MNPILANILKAMVMAALVAFIDSLTDTKDHFEDWKD
jgi:hypothetical protein